jgi:RNA polymerase sigma-70 factor (ECF subfamily)
MSPPVSALSTLPAELAPAEREADAAETARWFKAEMLPHAQALRAYLRLRFPEIADPDDLVQETYLRVLKAHAAGRAPLNKSYLFTVARNLGVDRHRRDQVVKIETLSDVEALPVLEESRNAAENACLDQEIGILADALRSLPERSRQVVTLRKIYGLTHREIAAQLGITEKTAMMHIYHGLAKLRGYLVAHGVTDARRP